MFKTTKQSLIDWQVTKNGKAHGWITKLPNGLYSLTLRELGKSVDYIFIQHKEAVSFAKSI